MPTNKHDPARALLEISQNTGMQHSLVRASDPWIAAFQKQLRRWPRQKQAHDRLENEGVDNRLLLDAMCRYTDPKHGCAERRSREDAVEARRKVEDMLHLSGKYRKHLMKLPESLDELPFKVNRPRRELLKALSAVEKSWAASVQFLRTFGSLKGQLRNEQLLYELWRALQQMTGRDCFVDLALLLSAAHNAHLRSLDREEVSEYSEDNIRRRIRRFERVHPEIVAEIDHILSGEFSD